MVPAASRKKKKRREIVERDIQGYKFFEKLIPLLEQLQDVGTERDKAGNRELFFDQYVCLLLLYFFNPILTSMRSLEQASGLERVQKTLGVRKTSLGSLSESVSVFDPAPLREIVQELASKARNVQHGLCPEDLRALDALTAVDGTFLRALPRMAWALGLDKNHASAKMHLQFDVFKSVPLDATVTAGIESETAQLKQSLKPSRLYVFDRGYINYKLYREILDVGSSFVARIKENSAFDVSEERPLSEFAIAAGVKQDLILSKLGTSHHKNILQQPVRLVIVEVPSPSGETIILRLLTDRLDLDAELVAMAYRYRWSIELFFRWFKCILGCRHLLSESAKGVTIQCYVALIASLLIVLWTGLKPTKRTWEMVQFYLSGWASFDELKRHLNSRQLAEARKAQAH